MSLNKWYYLALLASMLVWTRFGLSQELARTNQSLNLTYSTRTNGTKVFEDGVYSGELVDEEVRHGYGVFNFSDGDIYSGEWFYDTKNGEGTLVYVDGSVYEGSWHDDDFEGFGVFNYTDGSRYEGNWEKSLRHGKGVFYAANGAIYDGQWLNNQINGLGVMKYPDGGVYQGSWINGTRNRYGSMVYANQERYVGYWLNDERHYSGVYQFVNGERYEGEWYAGDMTGFGSYFLANGTKVYQGQWFKNKENGFGIAMTYDSMYYGEWRDGAKSGPGVIKYSTGELYIGEWEENKKNGKGFYYTPNGDQTVGMFDHGRVTTNSIFWNATEGAMYYEDIRFREADKSSENKTMSGCLDICVSDSACKALSFNQAEGKCQLFAVSQPAFESAPGWRSAVKVPRREINQNFLFNRILFA